MRKELITLIVLIFLLVLFSGVMIFNNNKLNLSIKELNLEREEILSELNTIKKSINANELDKINTNSIEQNQAEKTTTYSWIVEPRFDYEEVYYDNICNRLATVVNGEYKLLNTSTGEISNEAHSGHGGGGYFIAFNNQTKMYGLYNSGIEQVDFSQSSIATLYNNVKKEYSPNISNIFPILQFSTSKDKLSMLDGDDSILFEKVAYATEKGLLTDFIFDNYDQNTTASFPAVGKGNLATEPQKWGFINNDGKQIIDFIFEGAVSIDNEKAFVKLNGKWGIINKL